MNDCLITIFTPTYNRAYIIGNLYSSLLTQAYKNFEWLIVDDGSTDETEKLITKFINDDKITIRYYKQENGGKHRAINKGLEQAEGELFFIVDSDDTLPRESLSSIITHYIKIKDDHSIAGVVGLKCYSNGQTVGTDAKKEEVICTLLEYRYKYNIKGDRAEVIKTSIFKQYKFPEFNNEHFLPESIVWNKMALKYKLLYFAENVYECEYLSNGLSSSSIRLRKNNPKGITTLYTELASYPIPFFVKLRTTINYWRFARFLKEPLGVKIQHIGLLRSFIVLPLLPIVFFLDKKK